MPTNSKPTKAKKVSSKPKKAPSKNTATKSKTVKKTTPKQAVCPMSMKNTILLWVLIAALVLVFIAAFSYLIPKAKALDAAQSAPSVKHMPSPTLQEDSAE